MGQTPNKPKLGQEYGGLAVVVVLDSVGSLSVIDLIAVELLAAVVDQCFEGLGVTVVSDSVGSLSVIELNVVELDVGAFTFVLLDTVM